MNDIIITRAEIKEIAARIYNDVDSYDYQDAGYMLKDIELEVAKAMLKLVDRITSEFEHFAFAGNVRFYSSSLDFRPSRHCDAIGCESLVRADNDIWCYRHGEIEDRRAAEAAALVQFDDDDIPF